jgi:hypothetical protein
VTPPPSNAAVTFQSAGVWAFQARLFTAERRLSAPFSPQTPPLRLRLENRVGCRLIGEGIETEAELATLLRLGVPLGQGYLLGRPLPAPSP